jgi:MOSC domain-containing protein YiiM
MKIISTNIGRLREVEWNGRKITTGIFKEPVDEPLFLSHGGVNKDHVADLKVHGGSDKACYLYSADHYGYWKEIYPELNWHWGMFGENLTVEGLDEGKTMIGDIFKIGEAIVQVSQPRIPCYKLGIRLQSMRVVKQFLESPYPGVYVRVVEEGKVKTGDLMELSKPAEKQLSVREVFSLFTTNKANIELKELAIGNEFLAQRMRKDLS